MGAGWRLMGVIWERTRTLCRASHAPVNTYLSAHESHQGANINWTSVFGNLGNMWDDVTGGVYILALTPCWINFKYSGWLHIHVHPFGATSPRYVEQPFRDCSIALFPPGLQASDRKKQKHRTVNSVAPMKVQCQKHRAHFASHDDKYIFVDFPSINVLIFLSHNALLSLPDSTGEAYYPPPRSGRGI